MKDAVRRIRMAYMRHKAVSCSLPEFIGGSKVLIVAPHPDDEVLGCGGVIARLCDCGRPPHVIYMTGGEGSHGSCCDMPKTAVIAARRRLTSLAVPVLGLPAENIHWLDYPDGKIAACSEQTDRLRTLIAGLAPDYILVPHWGEGWPDHIHTADIVKKIIVGSKVPIYEYCVWMWYYNVNHLDWENARMLPLTRSELARKQSAVDIYTLPCAPCGKPWSGVLPKVFVEANNKDLELYFASK